MSFWTTLETVGTVLNNLNVGRSIGTLIVLDRARATQTLEEVVRGFTPEQLDEFEVQFLNAAMGMFTRDQRIRAMELYAYLKVLETTRYGQWRGFSTSTEAGSLS